VTGGLYSKGGAGFCPSLAPFPPAGMLEQRLVRKRPIVPLGGFGGGRPVRL
jgi:hypothetical protein